MRIRKGLEKYCKVEAQSFISTARFGGADHNLRDPLPTFTCKAEHELVQPFMVTLRRNHEAKSITAPLDTFVAGGTHHGLLQPFLTSYYSGSDQVSAVAEPVPTVTTGDRHALVEPNDSITTEDCYFRMLQPDEIKRAMAFAEDYIVLGNKREQVKQCGNAVTPPVMEMLVERCLKTLQ